MFRGTWVVRLLLVASGKRGMLCAGCALLVGAPPAYSFVLVRAVEPPPPAYAAGPTQTGATWEMILPRVEQVDYLCRLAMGGLPAGAAASAYYWGCYNSKLDAVILVARDGWPSRREWKANRAHEWAHARGWRHNPDGHGTSPASLPPPAAAEFSLAAREPAAK